MPIPDLLPNGYLPPGEHWATLDEIETTFGRNSLQRRALMEGLRMAVKKFETAGVQLIYVDGSFTTSKAAPNDIDGCYSVEGVLPQNLDPIFWKNTTAKERRLNRQRMRALYGLDFFIAESVEAGSGVVFPKFFQSDRNGDPKGILKVRLSERASATRSRT